MWKLGVFKIIFCLTQDDYAEAMLKLRETVDKAYKVKKDIVFEVFIHKVDGLNDDVKIETQRDICQRWSDDCAELGLESKASLNHCLWWGTFLTESISFLRLSSPFT